MSGNYDPGLKILREMLALSIMGKLDDCGFVESGFDDKTRERVYSRDIPNTKISVKGRHDPCVGIRAVPIGEAMLSCVLLDHFLMNRAQCG